MTYPKVFKNLQDYYINLKKKNNSEKPVSGNKVKVHYKECCSMGQFLIFIQKNQPIEFTLGIGQVIKDGMREFLYLV